MADSMAGSDDSTGHEPVWDKVQVEREVDGWQAVNPTKTRHVLVALRAATIAVIISAAYLDGHFVARYGRMPPVGQIVGLSWAIAAISFVLICIAFVTIILGHTHPMSELLAVLTGFAGVTVVLLAVFLLEMEASDPSREWGMFVHHGKDGVASIAGGGTQAALSTAYELARLFGTLGLAVGVIQSGASAISFLMQLQAEEVPRADPCRLQTLDFDPEVRIQRIYDSLREGGLI
ncbi:unnamed protein product (mitochondrion) [Plasmodiophora brassicae]|uniref:Uncharacterized protein n=1 Tax=Plasmodiophora brassicae TaxID=37360 RepID=A0A3P3YG44_PLABS|nr:unnamed protein product [Plasmodiophora brassicae]